VAFRPTVVDQDVFADDDPLSPSPSRNLNTTTSDSPGDRLLKNPMTGSADFCANAGSGNAAAVPNPAMNSRRFIAPRGFIRARQRSCSGEFR
jgi:hypothetical protein